MDITDIARALMCTYSYVLKRLDIVYLSRTTCATTSSFHATIARASSCWCQRAQRYDAGQRLKRRKKVLGSAAIVERLVKDNAFFLFACCLGRQRKRVNATLVEHVVISINPRCCRRWRSDGSWH